MPNWYLVSSARRGEAGNPTTDAHLAALAIEADATLHTADADFLRFRGMKWINPLDRSGEAVKAVPPRGCRSI
jgi:hypothetical protein